MPENLIELLANPPRSRSRKSIMEPRLHTNKHCIAASIAMRLSRRSDPNLSPVIESRDIRAGERRDQLSRATTTCDAEGFKQRAGFRSIGLQKARHSDSMRIAYC